MHFGVNSNTGRLRSVAMWRPGAILEADHEIWHYGKPINADALRTQFERFTSLVEESGAQIHWLPDDPGDGLADSVFVYDPSFTFPQGAVVMNLGKGLRTDEAALHQTFYESVGLPVLGSIEAPGSIEGGDCYWLDGTTLAVGRGFRTNQSGIDQLRAIVEPLGTAVEAYDLVYLKGPEACLHLMSVCSPLADDLAIVYAPLMPTALYQRMEQLGIELLHAPDDEFEASGGLNLNVLATAPREVIAIDGFPGTAQLMRDAGCEVKLFDASELCLPCEGGPTCLTRPLARD